MRIFALGLIVFLMLFISGCGYGETFEKHGDIPFIVKSLDGDCYVIKHSTGNAFSVDEITCSIKEEK